MTGSTTATESNITASPFSSGSFHHLRASDVIPRPEELLAVRCILQSNTEQKRLLENVASKLTQSLEELQQRLATLEEQIATHSGIISSLRRLPSELLHDIFVFARPDKSESLRSMVQHPPWTLARVCRRWREVCLMYGSLWSHVVIDRGSAPIERPSYVPRSTIESLHRPSLKAYSISSEILNLQLLRSKDADLFMTIGTFTGFDYAQPFLRDLLPHMHRCVYLSAPYHVLAWTYLPDRFDRLRYLKINYSKQMLPRSSNLADSLAPVPSRDEHVARNAQLMEHFSQQPNLSTFFLLLGVVDNHFPPALTRLDLVTRIDIEDFPTALKDRLLAILPQLVNLVDFRIDTLELVSDVREKIALTRKLVNPRIPRVSMSKLRNLEVEGETLIPYTLMAIVAPALTTLSYTGEFYRKTFSDFILASSCKLRSLSLKVHTHSGIIPFLDSTTNISSDLHVLKICLDDTDHPSSSSLIDLLTRSDNSTLVSDRFPQLEFLELSGMVASASHLMDMVESRRTLPGQQLQGVRLAELISEHKKFIYSKESIGTKPPRIPESSNYHLTWAEGLDREPEQLKRLEKLRDDGLQVSLLSTNVV